MCENQEVPTNVDLELPHSRRDDADDPDLLRRLAARKRGVHPDAIKEARVVRRSLDVRSKRVRWHLQVRTWLQDEEVSDVLSRQPPMLPAPDRSRDAVIVVGAGPAGLFAALTLAAQRVPVVLIERGKPVQARRHDLARITRGIAVDPDSNYCYGEGGAGTFSDGKLYTRSGDRREVEEVLRALVAHGAPPEILVDARPHIGSNRLPIVVSALRETLQRAGVDYRFGTRMVDLLVADGRAAGVAVQHVESGAREELLAPQVIVASGHGARDVLEILQRRGVALVPKAFAMGVRAEHPQELVDHIQYGARGRIEGLPPAAYSAAVTASERGVYSFCMCPGGWIVPSMTERGAMVLNGMSLSRRDSPFANSGIVVGIEPEDLVGERGRRWGVAELGIELPMDLEGAGPLFGLAVQAAVERLAWQAGVPESATPAHQAPAQLLVDFLAGRASGALPDSSYQPGLTPARLDQLLPAGIAQPLRQGLRAFASRLPGFHHPRAVVAAVESRTSCPVRVLRDRDTLESPSVRGLYPAGEGAGYAGGIVSAAIDGTRIARMVIDSKIKA